MSKQYEDIKPNTLHCISCKGTKDVLIDNNVVVRVIKESTIINRNVNLKNIGNLKSLPKATQKFLFEELDNFTVSGSQNLLGHIGRKLVFDALGYWENDKFYIMSYGISNIDKSIEAKYRNLVKQWKE